MLKKIVHKIVIVFTFGLRKTFMALTPDQLPNMPNSLSRFISIHGTIPPFCDFQELMTREATG